MARGNGPPLALPRSNSGITPKGNTVTTAKKAAAAPAKTTAASGADSATKTDSTTTAPAADSGEGTENEGDEATADSGSTNAASTAVESGPQTGTAAPAESARPPATIVNQSPDAAPLSPPADHATQTEPANGHTTSSTDQTYAEVGGRTIAGENHIRLVDHKGDTIDPEALFHDESPRHTHVVAAQRVSEEFSYPGSGRVVKRLIYPKGAHVPRGQAARIVAAATADAEAAKGSAAE